jgi:hypothetical protein
MDGPQDNPWTVRIECKVENMGNTKKVWDKMVLQFTNLNEGRQNQFNHTLTKIALIKHKGTTNYNLPIYKTLKNLSLFQQLNHGQIR